MIKRNLKIKMIKTDDIFPNPYQVRKNFDKREIEELSASIKAVGILAPLIVRGCAMGFELLCGQRRLRAAILAGLKEVPAIIIKAGDLQCAQLSLIENIHHKTLSFYEEAEGFYNLVAYHRLKKDRLPVFLGVAAEKISEKIKLLSLGEATRCKIEKANLSESAARELCRLHEEENQAEIIERIERGDLCERETALAVTEMLRKSSQKKREKAKKGEMTKKKRTLYANTISRAVEMMKQSGAKAEFSQKERPEYIEYTIKISK